MVNCFILVLFMNSFIYPNFLLRLILISLLLIGCGDKYDQNMAVDYQDKKNNDLNALVGESKKYQKKIGIYLEKFQIEIVDGLDSYPLKLCLDIEDKQVVEWQDCQSFAYVPTIIYDDFLASDNNLADDNKNSSDDSADGSDILENYVSRMSSRLAAYDGSPVMRSSQLKPLEKPPPWKFVWKRSWENLTLASFTALLFRYATYMFLGWWLIPPTSVSNVPLLKPANMGFFLKLGLFMKRFSINNMLHSKKLHAALFITFIISLPIARLANKDLIDTIENQKKQYNMQFNYLYTFFENQPELSYDSIIHYAFGKGTDEFLEIIDMDYTRMILSLVLTNDSMFFN